MTLPPLRALLGRWKRRLCRDNANKAPATCRAAGALPLGGCNAQGSSALQGVRSGDVQKAGCATFATVPVTQKAANSRVCIFFAWNHFGFTAPSPAQTAGPSVLKTRHEVTRESSTPDMSGITEKALFALTKQRSRSCCHHKQFGSQ